MKMTRDHMTQYLLYFCRTFEERDAEEFRLNSLSDEALLAEFTAEYNEMQGNVPSRPLYER